MKVKLQAISTPQLEFWANPAKYRAFVAGIRAGKTRAGAAEAILRQRAGTTGGIITPVLRDQKRVIIPALRHYMEPSGLEEKINLSDMDVYLTNGTKIHLCATDSKHQADRLRGLEFDWVWLDEAAMMPKEVYDITLGRMSGRDARLWITTTPRGKNWLFHEFTTGKPGRALIHSKTRDNISLPEDYIESVEAAYSSHFRQQELEGAFVEPEGGLFKRAWFKFVDEAPGGLNWSRFWDPAFSEEHEASATASLEAAIDAKANVYFRNGIHDWWNWPTVVRQVRETALRERNTTVGVEAVGAQKGIPDSLLEEPELVNISIVGIGVSKNKVERAKPVMARLENGKVYLVRGAWNEDCISEACMFTGERGDRADWVDAMSGCFGMLDLPTSGEVYGVYDPEVPHELEAMI